MNTDGQPHLGFLGLWCFAKFAIGLEASSPESSNRTLLLICLNPGHPGLEPG